MNRYQPAIAIITIGFVLWITGILVTILLPALTAVGVVCVLFGKLTAIGGALVFVALFIRSLV